jgi:hypothetical protein
MGLFATRPVQRVLLYLGVALHLGIMLLMGLTTFSITMFAALILYLRPTDEPFSWPWASVLTRLAGLGWPRSPKLEATAALPRYAAVAARSTQHEAGREAADCG